MEFEQKRKSIFQEKGRVKKRHEIVRGPLKATLKVSKTQQKKLGAKLRIEWEKRVFLILLLSPKPVFLASIHPETKVGGER